MHARDSVEVQFGQINAFRTSGDLGFDLDELEYSLTLAPLERLIRHDQALELILAVRQAGIRHYGFDPGLPEDSERP